MINFALDIHSNFSEQNCCQNIMPSSFVTNHVHNKFVVILAAKILILYGSYFSVVSIQPAQVV